VGSLARCKLQWWPLGCGECYRMQLQKELLEKRGGFQAGSFCIKLPKFRLRLSFSIRCPSHPYSGPLGLLRASLTSGCQIGQCAEGGEKAHSVWARAKSQHMADKGSHRRVNKTPDNQPSAGSQVTISFHQNSTLCESSFKPDRQPRVLCLSVTIITSQLANWALT
jgi:hypothetical protein